MPIAVPSKQGSRLLPRSVLRRTLVLLAGLSAAGASPAAAAAWSPAPAGPPSLADDTLRAFPGAQGWAARTPGGRGGRIIRVTTLAASGPGSFREAVRATGPRIVVFEVGGTIDLAGEVISISEPFVTIAGQTAPSPGITFLRGGLRIETHDVVMQHLRVRAGEAGRAKKSGWEVDGIVTTGANARDVIIDHCSVAWATDENLSSSGPRFGADGAGSVEQWRAGTSRRVTLSNNIIAEGLSNSTHAKGEHSKGTLIHDNATDILVLGNLYASNMERNPLFKGGVRGAVVNNLVYNPGRRAVHYNLWESEWGEHAPVVGQMALVGNVLRYGPSTRDGVPLLWFQGSGDLEFFADDNLALDRAGRAVELLGVDTSERTTAAPRRVASAPLWPADLRARPAAEVQEAVLRDAGARPWDRDAVDQRIVREVREGRGRIVDSEQEVGGYPAVAATRQRFDPAQWDLRYMVRRASGTR